MIPEIQAETPQQIAVNFMAQIIKQKVQS